MSDNIASDLGAASGSGLGGKRIPGQRSEKSQTNRDAAIKATKQKWGVSEFVDIFPPAIRPQGDLGDSAVLNLRQIANKVPDLEAARLLMIEECVDNSGRPVKLSFKNTSNILARLRSLETKAAADEKDKEQKDKAVPKALASSKSSESPALGYVLATNPSSVPTKGSAAAKAFPASKAKASAPAKISTKSKTPAGTIASAPVNTPTAAKSLVPATSSDQGKNPALNKSKVSMPAMQPLKTGKPASRIVPHTSLIGLKSNNKEVASGLHVPSAKDVAPFSSNKLATVKKPSSDKRVSFTLEEELDDETTHGLLQAQGVTLGESISGVPRLMTDENGVPTNINTGKSKIKAKRNSDGAEEPAFKKLKFDKEPILADLNFVRRTSFQKDGYLTAGQTPSEADTEIDIESVPKLLADNVAIKYGFDDAGQREAADIDSGKKPFRDAIVGPEMLSDISMERPKSKKLMRFFLGKVENEANESFTYTRPIRRQWAIAVSAPKPAENVAASDTKINTQKPAILIMSTASQQDSKEIAIKESTTKLEKTPSNYLESPISPSHSPDREETIHSSAGRRLSEIHNSKRAKVTGSFSLTTKVRNNRTLSPENTSSNLTTKTDHEASMPNKDTMENPISEVVDQAKERSPKSTKADEPVLTPKALVTPAKGTSAIPRKPNSTLPKLPETLTARIPADRALILSIPGIITAYINELRAAIPDGKAPDGDLLSMIIVNKYGYFLEHVEKLDKELISLYYEAVDRAP